MPAGNGTGPMGDGPMTGRGAGFCAGYSAPGYANSSPRGEFFRSGRGGGSGRGQSCGNRGNRACSPGECLCLQCGTVTPHSAGIPCNEKRCPKCGSVMVRK